MALHEKAQAPIVAVSATGTGAAILCAIERIAVGTRLGPYEIVARIGAGGMGEVWRANDTRLGRAVAVKILPPELAHNAQLKVRFEREARAISQLSHPNICTLYDVGEENGVAFLVMELLEGENLAQRLDRGALPLPEILDGKWFTFAAEGADDEQPALWIRAFDSLEARKLITEEFEFPFWSADSRSIAYFAGGKLKRIDVSGGPPTIICDAQEGRGGAWSADGTIVFAPHWRGPLHRVSASGGKSEPLTRLDEKAGETTHRFPSFLPDGKHFIYLGGTHLAAPSSERNAIYLASLDSRERKLLLRARSNAIYSNGHLLFVRENYLLAQPLDPDDLDLGTEAKRLADSVEYESGFFSAAFGAAADGTLVYAPKAAPVEEPFVWRDRSGKTLGTLTVAPGPWHHRLSPDGRSVVMVYGDPSDLWVYDVVRGSRRRLTHDPLNDYLPVWSPDGSRVVYASDRSEFAHLYVRRADGTGEEELLLKTNQMKSPSDWSRDGRYLFFEAASDANTSKNDLWVVDMTNRKPRQLTGTDFDEWGTRISPDGRWITYVSDESGRRETYVTSFPSLGERQQVSTNGSASDGIWTSGGREIVYITPDHKAMSVRVTGAGNTLQVSTPQELFTLPRRGSADVTADGQKFLVYEPVDAPSVPLTLVTNWR